MTMREALEKAAAQFEFYAKEHRAKASAAMTTGPTIMSLEKATTNEDFAKMCRDALREEEEGR